MYIDSGVYKLEQLKEYYHALMTGAAQKVGAFAPAVGSNNFGVTLPAGKNIVVEPFTLRGSKALAAAGSAQAWFIFAGAGSLTFTSANAALYYGNLQLNSYISAWTSGSVNKSHGYVDIGSTLTSIYTNLNVKTAIGAAELGDGTDAKSMIDRPQVPVLFSDIRMDIAGTTPNATMTTNYVFTGWKIYTN